MSGTGPRPRAPDTPRTLTSLTHGYCTVDYDLRYSVDSDCTQRAHASGLCPHAQLTCRTPEPTCGVSQEGGRSRSASENQNRARRMIRRVWCAPDCGPECAGGGGRTRTEGGGRPSTRRERASARPTRRRTSDKKEIYTGLFILYSESEFCSVLKRFNG